MLPLSAYMIPMTNEAADNWRFHSVDNVHPSGLQTSPRASFRSARLVFRSPIERTASKTQFWLRLGNVPGSVSLPSTGTPLTAIDAMPRIVQSRDLPARYARKRRSTLGVDIQGRILDQVG